MTLYYIYTLCFIALSGLGVVFLNPESILALCFFIFFALILQNAEGAGQSLEDTRQAVQAELVSCMLDGQKNESNTAQLQIFQKTQLLSSIEHLKR